MTKKKTEKKTKKKTRKAPWELVKGDIDKFHGEILGREFVFNQMHRLFVTAFKKGKDRFIRIDKSGPLPEGGKYYDQHLAIHRARHWNAIVQAVDMMSHQVGWKEKREATQFAQLMSDFDLRAKKSSKQHEDVALQRLQRNRRLKDEVEKYKEKLADFMELYRTSNLPKFRRSLNDFKQLVSQKKAERFYQKFLEDPANTWILGLEYVAVNRHKRAGTVGNPDFVPQRFDGYHDVIEFKKPSDVLFEYKNNHWRQSVALKDGISQLMNYLELYDRNPAGSDKLGDAPDKYRPNGCLVIGDLRGDPQKSDLKIALRTHNSFLQRITITTYDELIEQGNSILSNLELKTKNK